MTQAMYCKHAMHKLYWQVEYGRIWNGTHIMSDQGHPEHHRQSDWYILRAKAVNCQKISCRTKQAAGAAEVTDDNLDLTKMLALPLMVNLLVTTLEPDQPLSPGERGGLTLQLEDFVQGTGLEVGLEDLIRVCPHLAGQLQV